jgi:hypothetical protein
MFKSSPLGSVAQKFFDKYDKGKYKDVFRKAGLFAKGGVFRMGKEAATKRKTMNFLAGFLGGTEGLLADQPIHMQRKAIKDYVFKTSKFIYPGKFVGMAKSARSGAEIFERANPTVASRVENIYRVRYKRALEEVRRNVFGISNRARDLRKSPLGKAAIGEAGLKGLSKAVWARRIATVGKGLSAAFWGKLAFDVASGGANYMINKASVTADDIQKSVSNMVNRHMEFGGTIDPVFYTGRAATERQRAIQAMRNNRINARPAMNSEAELMHVGNTW